MHAALAETRREAAATLPDYRVSRIDHWHTADAVVLRVPRHQPTFPAIRSLFTLHPSPTALSAAQAFLLTYGALTVKIHCWPFLQKVREVETYSACAPPLNLLCLISPDLLLYASVGLKLLPRQIIPPANASHLGMPVC